MTEINGAALELLRSQREVKLLADSGYKIRISNEYEDRDWDAFLAETPGGHYAQTSWWAQAQADLGWRVIRIVISRQDKIVAGAQILLYPITLAGAIGYVPKGPVLAQSPLLARADTKLATLILQELQAVAKRLRIQYLAIQPPSNGEVLTLHLLQAGFYQDVLEVEPNPVLQVNLQQDLNARLAVSMPNTHFNPQNGANKNLKFRQGTEADLPAYYQLLLANAQPEAPTLISKDHLGEMWRILHKQHLKLFLVEDKGEIIAAQLAILLGSTLFNKLSVWSPQHNRDDAQTALHWFASKWAKAQGLHYYEVEAPTVETFGLRPAEQVSNQAVQLREVTVNFAARSFNLGDVVKHYPHVYTYVYNPFWKWTCTAVLPKLIHSSPFAALFQRLKMH